MNTSSLSLFVQSQIGSARFFRHSRICSLADNEDSRSFILRYITNVMYEANSRGPLGSYLTAMVTTWTKSHEYASELLENSRAGVVLSFGANTDKCVVTFPEVADDPSILMYVVDILAACNNALRNIVSATEEKKVVSRKRSG